MGQVPLLQIPFKDTFSYKSTDYKIYPLPHAYPGDNCPVTSVMHNIWKKEWIENMVKFQKCK